MLKLRNDYGYLFPSPSGQNTHVLLSILIKHLDHKSVPKDPDTQIEILNITTSLGEHAKIEASVAIIGAVSDIMRLLRKCIHCLLDDQRSGPDAMKWNRNFQEAVEKCLVQLSSKVMLFSHTFYFMMLLNLFLLFLWKAMLLNLVSSFSLTSKIS